MSTDNGETRSKRESKKVERFEVEVSEKKELEVGGGSGTSSIGQFVTELNIN